MAGTAFDSSLGFVSWEAEDSFADQADNTVTTIMQVRDDQVDVSGLSRPMLPAGGVFARFNQRDFDRPGAYGLGTFTTTFDLAGHGSQTTGSLTQTDLVTLLGHAVGNAVSSQVGGLLTAGTNDVNTLTSTNTTLLQGGITRVGLFNDGRAEGQPSVLADADSPYELLADLPAAPTTADVARAMQMVYPVSTVANGGILTSDGSTSNNTLRFQLGTANAVYVAKGCAATGITLSIPMGGIPTIAIEWSAVYWEPIGSVTFPPTETLNAKTPVPTANGSLFIQDQGTTTRNTEVPLSWSVTIGQNVIPRFGTNGENAYQNVVGWVRGNAETTLEVVVEAEAQTASPTWWDYHSTQLQSTAKHALLALNVTDGASICIYLPELKAMSAVPTQTSTDGLNTVTVMFRADTNTADTTNELTLSAWRMGLG